MAVHTTVQERYMTRTEGLTTLCPSGHAGCGSGDVIADPLSFSGLTVTSPSGTSGVNAPWDDTVPNFGGIGVSDDSAAGGTGDDQITDSEILALTFDSPTTLTGVGTLFDNGHATFGANFADAAAVQAVASSIVFQMMVSGPGCVGTCDTWFNVLFQDANNMALNLTGTTFSFMQAAQNPEFYVSAVTTVPVPAALPLFASGLAGLGWLSRRRRKQLQAA